MSTEQRIQRLRKRIIEVVEKADKGHLGTSLSSLEAILAIRDHMKGDDLFISSKGHDAVAQYVVLAEHDLLSEDKLDAFRTKGGLPGHPTVDIPGIEANTGSLGMGLSKALGFALGQDRKVYVLLGDGEMMEGQNWEAALAISNRGANNIIAMVDYNKFSQDGPTDLSMHTIVQMFIAAGWNVTGVQDGNNYDDICDLLQDIDTFAVDDPTKAGPWAIMLDTVKGKGTKFEGTVQSHFGLPDVEYPTNLPMVALGVSVELVMEQNEDVILIGADTMRDLNLYRLHEKFPDRVFDFGIAEQNAVSFASARALMGQKPIFATYACFLRRCAEQIYNATTEDTNIIYIGTMAGPLPPDGPGISHQSLDDDIWMGTMMDTFEPKADEIYRMLRLAIANDESSYMRILV